MSKKYNEFMGQKLENVIVNLPFSDGSNLECGVFAYYEAGGKDYVALLPLKGKKQMDFSHNFMLYEVQKDAEGNPTVVNIENDDDFNLAADFFSFNYSR